MSQIQVPKGWELKTLDDVAEFLDRKRSPVNSSERERRIKDKDVSKLFPYFGANGQVGWIDDYIFNEELVVLAEDGGFFEDKTKPIAYIIKGKTWVNNHAHVLRPKKGIELEYLKNILNCTDMLSYVKGTTRLKLNQGDAKRIILPIAPNPIQKKVVQKLDYILGEFDEKKKQFLELRNMNKLKLQSFKANFLPFMIEKIIPFKKLPRGWKLGRLESFSLRITDGEHFRPQTQETGIPFLSAKDVRDDSPKFDNCLFVSQKDAKKFWNRCNPEKNDILMVSRGATIGRTCINNTNEKFCLLGSVILIKLKPKINSEYIHYCLKSRVVQKNLVGLSGSSAQQAIYLIHLRNLELPFPSDFEEQRKLVQKIKTYEELFNRFIEKLNRIITLQEHTVNYVDNLKITILNNAFSGKLVN